jgi:hypothetical protein
MDVYSIHLISCHSFKDSQMYYDLMPYIEYQGRWRLGRLRLRSGVRVDSRVFCRGRRVESNDLLLSAPKLGVVDFGGPIIIRRDTRLKPEEYELTPVETGWERNLVFPIERRGIELEFNGPELLPVVVEPLAEALRELAPSEVQLFPVEIPGQSRRYCILNVTEALDCIDERRTRGEHNPPGSSRKYRNLSDVHIVPEIAAGHHLFRLANWEVALICSKRVRELFELHRVRGALFEAVV